MCLSSSTLSSNASNRSLKRAVALPAGGSSLAELRLRQRGVLSFRTLSLVKLVCDSPPTSQSGRTHRLSWARMSSTLSKWSFLAIPSSEYPPCSRRKQSIPTVQVGFLSLSSDRLTSAGDAGFASSKTLDPRRLLSLYSDEFYLLLIKTGLAAGPEPPEPVGCVCSSGI
jgi:hypothetical protein